MHVRHRNGPGHGYRSNNVGVGGMAAASRISPEGSMRGQRMYNTDYRNNARGGYSRGGHSKHSPRLPPRETDIFMEAGKLAAEYLVSTGVLPLNALSGKWTINDVKDQVNNFQGFRQLEADKTRIAADGRASAHSRLGNVALEAGPSWRRYSDEYSMGSRSSVRGRKRTGPFKNFGSEINRELGRSGSLAEASGASSGMEADNDSFGHHAQQHERKDGNPVMQSSSPGESIQGVDSESPVKSGSEKCNSADDMHVDNGALNSVKSLPLEVDGEHIRQSDDATDFNDESHVPKTGRNHDSLPQRHVDNKVKSSTKDDTLVSEDHFDLAKHCKFVNLRTKARSSLTKGPKGAQNSMNEVRKIASELSEFSGAQVMNVGIGSSSCNDISHQSRELNSLQSNVSSDPSMEKDLGVTCTVKPGQCLKAGSFPDKSASKEKESDEGTSGLQNPNLIRRERSTKRVIDYTTDDMKDSKKIRQWVSPVDAQSNVSSPLSSSIKNPPELQEPNTSHSALGTLVSDQKIVDTSLPPKADSCESMEEKQLFPGSFKTCDLNLSGSSDVTENRDADPLIIFPSITQPEEGVPIDVDLSMGNNHNMPDKNCKHGVKSIDIEVIDLENDSAEVQKAFSNPERRADTLFTDLDGFPNNMHNSDGIPDVQDGYGLMISELLGNDSPSCSAQTDLNSLNNHMALSNTEGMLGDDDSIYMSLGEIPISLLGPWEQPMQDYGKPF
ncbi:uncharacterized protein At4g26450-like [Andrographis paniculata]|uniref:uncharacterized protein At4g26450-like n=1 Tax=Andrographis paniculata TaxID=175694 RepID=UPI0021E97CE0|nr:uncharacterized protein At4g26450-like [Andrographis paniculata]